MRHSFLILIAIISLNSRQVLWVYVKRIQVKRGTKPYRDASFVCSLVCPTWHTRFDHIPCCKAHVRRVTHFCFGSGKAVAVHKTHLTCAMSRCLDTERLDALHTQHIRGRSTHTGRVNPMRFIESLRYTVVLRHSSCSCFHWYPCCLQAFKQRPSSAVHD